MSDIANHLGNVPDGPKVPEVEFSTKEILREEVKIYRQPDHGCAQTCQSWPTSAGDLPGAGHQQRYLLQVACQVRLHGHLHDGANEGDRRLESAPQEDVPAQ